jgi:transcriptional regulator with XRE-family HTH domain
MSRWFGVNLKLTRERLGESQTGLAKKMADLGFPWHQTTVSRIEVGERPVQLVEALALAKVMDVNVGDMLQSPEDVRLTGLVQKANRHVVGLLTTIEMSTNEVIRAKIELESHLAAAKDAGLDAKLIDTVTEWLAKEPEDMVRDGRTSAEQILETQAALQGTGHVDR